MTTRVWVLGMVLVASTATPFVLSGRPGLSGVAPGVRGAEFLEAGAAADTLPFRHRDHSDLECTACHETGTATVASTQQWCADCHHVRTDLGECGRCHGGTSVQPAPRDVLQTLRFSVGGPKTRSLPFDHQIHVGLSCADCHVEGTSMEVDRPCAACHDDHHVPEAACAACHTQPAPEAHSIEVHATGCAVSGCHSGVDFELETMLNGRSLCLSCHQDQIDHEPRERCARCHLIPLSEDR